MPQIQKTLYLSSADVRSCLISPDMLLPGLQGQPIRQVTIAISGKKRAFRSRAKPGYEAIRLLRHADHTSRHHSD